MYNDLDWVIAIADRAVQIAAQQKILLDRRLVEARVLRYHSERPLRLEDLFAADNFNFIHDVFGILKGEDPLFLPRFCVHQ
jgi:hypothetical protein